MSTPSSAPPRRFLPTPVETTARSSKDVQQSQSEEQAPLPRRFIPQAVETSTKSSKDRRQRSPETGDLKKVRRFAPEPVETSSKSSKDKKPQEEGVKSKPRKFAPEPVETSTKSSKDRQASEEQKPAPRKFAVQPVETSQKSSKDKEQGSKPQIKFNPSLVETTYGSNRKHKQDDGSKTPEIQEPPKPAPRKFAPVLIDTAKRSRRSGDNKPALAYKDRTEQGHNVHAREHRRHITGYKTPMAFDQDRDQAESNHRLDPSALEHSLDLRRQISPLNGRPRTGSFRTRTHSYHLPDLDTIESSESERHSPTSSVSTSPEQNSPITASDSSYPGFKHATRIRESIDENFSHYLLQLEAKRAEARLQEQALAAFPNSDFHEPVQHYVNEEETDSGDDLEDRPTTWEGHDDDFIEKLVRIRRESTKVPWEQLEMQRHAEKMEQDRKANIVTTKQPSTSPWWTPSFQQQQAEDDNEFRNMRDRARPPMLGDELRFPRCKSPEPARFDVTQGSATLRNQVSDLNEQSGSQSKQEEESGLWHGMNTVDTNEPAVKEPSTSSKKDTEKGLWNGFCFEEGEQNTNTLAPPSQETGLMTPRFEPSTNPFEFSFAVPNGTPASIPNTIKTPSTPRTALREAQAQNLNEVLITEAELDNTMERDYPDSFITQVYNYLSLGYPALARPFDGELSKISQISIAELRRDDAKAKQQPRGYIRLGQDFEGGGGEVSEETCMRWCALKKYVREWAKQEKRMVHVDGPGGNWGTAARRGSWGI